jgi:Domain of unknown function (DUF4845)
MRHSQRGITFIGWLILLVPIAVVGYAGIRLVPVYLNYMNVSKALSLVVSEAKSSSGGLNPVVLRTSVEKNFDVQSIEHPSTKDLDIHREGDHMVIIADYEDVVPMFGNVSLLVQFHKQVEMQ